MNNINYENLNAYNSGNHCSKYSVQSFNNAIGDSKNHLMFVHHNIRSFNKNYDELSVFLEQIKVTVSIIILSETWFTENFQCDIEGFQSYHVYRTDRRGGGVSVFVRDNLCSVSLHNLCIVDDLCETCGVAVQLSDNMRITVVGLYRPPGITVIMFGNFMQNNILSKVNASDADI